MSCVFGSPNQWASIREISSERFIHIAKYEQRFDCTIHRSSSVEEQAACGTPYPMDPKHIALAMSTEYTEPILMENWTLPSGAYGESCGPT